MLAGLWDNLQTRAQRGGQGGHNSLGGETPKNPNSVTICNSQILFSIQHICSERPFLCDKGMAIPQIKFGFFLAFKNQLSLFLASFRALLGFLLKFSSGNPGQK